MSDPHLSRTTPAIEDRRATQVDAVVRPKCPECGSAVDRIPRRWIDRILSRFSHSRRYRCRSMACKWEGNLRNTQRASQDVGADTRRYDRRIDPP